MTSTMRFLLTPNTMDGSIKVKINQELLKNNLQYSQLQHSFENTRKFNSENTTDLEKEATPIDSLKTVNVVKQVVNANTNTE